MNLLKKLLILIIFLSGLSAVAFAPDKDVSAANAANFQAGRIIDDSIFTNRGSMSAHDIQAFLNSKVPVCDTWHAGSGSNQPPFTCLKDYNEGGISAAQIIWNKAQEFNINPQVMLVLLQKEQGLITDTWPWAVQYRSATGYGCPDGADCDAQYYGFTNQVHHANRMFRKILDNDPNWYMPFRNTGSNFVQYNPNGGCGGLHINVVNRATLALYNYTPYQPNSAALGNLYGTGDGCSAYGNRNFWRDFTDWFGATQADSYKWEFAGQSSSKDLTQLKAGEKAVVTVSAKNVGIATWSPFGANPVKLGTFRPADRVSAFAVQNHWVAYNRPDYLDQASVAPGETGTFTFNIQAPPTPGNYREYFNLVADGAAWMNDIGQYFDITVVPATYSGSVQSNTIPSSISADASTTATVTVINNGNVTWYKDGNYQIKLGTYNPIDRSSEFFTSGWLASNRLSLMNEVAVAPGGTATFSFPLKAPTTPGTRIENFSLVAEFLTWFNQSISNTINVQGSYTWSIEAQAAYTDSSKSTSVDLTNLSPGQTAWLSVQARNTGTSTWQKAGANPVRLGTEGQKDRSSRYFTSGSWVAANRPALLSETSVAPNGVGTFEFPITVPSGGGNFAERFNLVAEGLTWFHDAGLTFSTQVKSGYQLSFVDQYAYTDANKTTPVDVNNLTPGQTFLFGVKVRNASSATWFKAGNYPFRLGTSRPLDHISQFHHSSWLSQNRITAMQETSVAPNSVATFEAIYTAPSAAGSYKEYLLPVVDGVTWLNDIGIYIPARVVSP